MKKKVLFIDRDGTLIWEPPDNFQIDAFEKYRLLPGVITNLARIAKELDYELAMVTNQDGLGTANFPEDTFWPVQNHLIQTLEGEGIRFRSIHIDRSYENDPLPTRKPGTGMLTAYLGGDYDLANSYVIGDRITDVRLAQNLGAKSILIKNYDSPEGWEDKITRVVNGWDEIYAFLKLPERRATLVRKTNETDITVSLNLDGTGKADVKTGVAFFDHMLEQLAKHGGIDLAITANGDLHIDEHHTVEDTALALGETMLQALGNKRGLMRYGFLLPMDDCLAQVAIDFGGRPWLVWDAKFSREKIGDMPTELFFHFFKSFSDTAKCNLNIKAEGENEHHKIEAIFKAWAKAIKMAVQRDAGNMQLPSTKGVL